MQQCRETSSNFAAIPGDTLLQIHPVHQELPPVYGVQATSPSSVAGAGGAAVPMKMAQVRDELGVLATAAQPVLVTPDRVTMLFPEGP